MNTFIIIAASLLMGASPLNTDNPSKIRLIDTFPKAQHNVSFKSSPSFSIDVLGNIYAVDNRNSSAYKIDLIRDEGKQFAKQGQGLGDLQYPRLIYVKDPYLFIGDDIGLTLFNLDGKYQNRIRLFETYISVGADADTIYVAQAGSKHLIQEYSYSGKRKKEYGDKYLYDPKIYRDFSASMVDACIHGGKILIGEKYVYFVSFIFSELFVYDHDGKLVARKIIDDDDLTKESRELYFRKGQNSKTNEYGAFERRLIILDASIFRGRIYLLRLYKDSSKKMSAKIVELAENKLDSIVRREFDKTEDSFKYKYFREFCVGGTNLIRPRYFLSLYDEKLEDFVIKVYQEVQ